MTRLALFAALALLLASPALAKDAPAPAPTPAKPEAAKASPAATAMVDLFDKSCVAYAGRIARLKIWLDANATPAKDEAAAYFLSGMEGKVWLLNKPGNYAIVVSDALQMCMVKAEKAPVDDVATYFTTTAAPAQKLALKQTGDSPDGNFMGVAGRVVTYTLHSDGVDYLVVLAGRQKANIPIQSQLALALQGSDSDQ